MAEPHVEADQPAAGASQQRERGPHARFADTPDARHRRRQPFSISWLSREEDAWPVVLRALVVGRRWARATARCIVRWRLALAALAAAPILLALFWPGTAEKRDSAEPPLAPTYAEPVSSTPSAPSPVEHEPELFERIRDQRAVPFDQLRIDRGD